MRRGLVLPSVVLAVLGLTNLPSAQAVPGSAVTPAAAVSTAGTYHPVSVARAFDTRTGVGVTRRAVPAGGTVTVPVAGRAGVPKTGVSAVSVTITVLSAVKTGSVTVFPGGARRPSAGTVSFTAARTEQSTLVAQLGASGSVSIHNNSAGSVQLVGDVAGYYLAGTPSAAGAFGVVTTTRVLDTRTSSAIPAHGSRSFRVGGVAGVPSSGTGAAVLDIGVLSPSGSNTLTAYPGRTTRPGAASLNYSARTTVQREVTQQLGSDGSVAIGNNSGFPLTVVVDVIGYYRAGTPSVAGGFAPASHVRVFDTRLSEQYSDGPIAAHGARPVAVLGSTFPQGSLLPASGSIAAAVAVTVLHPATAGSVTLYRTGVARPTASTISFTAGNTSTGTEAVTLGGDGAFEIANNTGKPLDVVVEVTGSWFGRATPLTFGTPAVTDLPQTVVVDESCSSATSCMAFENDGSVLMLTGTSWSAPVNVTRDEQIVSVSCPTTGFCMATGKASAHWNGSAWSDPVEVDPGSVLWSSCVSAAFCLGVDYEGNSTVWDGTSWSTLRPISGAPKFTSVSCVSATFCVAGDNTGNALTFDGTSWSAPVPVVAVTGAGRYSKVSCTSVRFCAFTAAGAVSSFDGTAWTTAKVLAGGTTLTAVSCVSSQFCVTTDGSNAYFYDGTGWSAAHPAASLGSLTCATSQFCVGFGPTDDVRPTTFDGAAWHTGAVLDTWDDRITGLSCVSATFCMEVNHGSRAYQFDGTRWTPEQVEVPGPVLSAVSCASATFCAAVDGSGNAITFDGHRWATPVPLGVRHLTTVSCGSPTLCVALSDTGDVYIWNGSHWARSAGQQDHLMTLVSCTTSTWCMAVNPGGATFIYNGKTWSAGAMPLTGDVSALDCTSPSYCLLGYRVATLWDGTTSGPSRGGLVTALYDGSRWTRLPANNQQSFSSISCPGPGHCLGVTSDGGSRTVTALDGQGWAAPVPLNVPNVVVGLSCPVAGFCVVADYSGATAVGRTPAA